MDPHRLPVSPSSPEPKINTQRESHLLGRSQQQIGKKRKSDHGEGAKGFKKRKEGLEQELKNLDAEISRLNSIISEQENLMDNLLDHLLPESEELKQLLNEECPDPNWYVWMSESNDPNDIILKLNYRCKILDRRIRLLYEMIFK